MDGPSRTARSGVPTGGIGPTGMLNALGHPPENYVVVCAEVADIDAAIARAISAGGEMVVGPMPLTDNRRFAWVKDTAGNMLGLLRPRV